MSLGVTLECPLWWHSQTDPQLEKNNKTKPQSHITEPILAYSLRKLWERSVSAPKMFEWGGNWARNGVQALGNTEQLS